MESQIWAAGSNSFELDESTTGQININNDGLQYFHKYIFLLSLSNEGYLNL
jgi:hypothetical protein